MSKNHAPKVTDTDTDVDATPSFRLPDASSSMEGALARALDFCARKMGLPAAEIALECVRQGDMAAREYCHYSLASQVAEALGALDENVKSVSMYGYDATPEDLSLAEGSRAPMIHLIVWAQRRTGALHSLVSALDDALTQEYASLVGPRRMAHLLDAQVITDEDVERRIGVAALLSSLYNPALPVWER
jgi:hypothetical protein